jgi:hypothetical protein
MAPPVGYIAYIDEAGDDGLETVGAAGKAGASEWWVMSAVVIKADREQETLKWGGQIVNALKQPQIQTVHFRKLKLEKQIVLCKLIASLDLRVFTFISHKANMQGYKNLHAELAKVNKTAWFYAWCSKILLESVTDFVGRRSKRDHEEKRLLRLEFSSRGGVNIDDIRKYYKYIKDQAKLGLSFNKTFPLDWDVIDPSEMFIYPNSMRIGLQLSDAVASSFYSAVSMSQGRTPNAQCAISLSPRVGRDAKGRQYMYGVKVMPRSKPHDLPAIQKPVFDFYKDK